ncbi:hypothetical protein ACFL6I_17505 [candidate division KSB1 bacterium]
MNIRIQNLGTIQEYQDFVEMEKFIWRLPDYGDCIPVHILKAVQEIGGLVLGAYENTTMVGMLMIMPAYSLEDGFHHHSHILGVHPKWVYNKVGYLLKKTHYEIAVTRGIKKVTWTYDPLQGPNGNLNIAKLGATVSTYHINYYGEIMGESELISGLPTDRFWVEWSVDSERVRSRIRGTAAKNKEQILSHMEPVNSVKYSRDNCQVITGYRTDLKSQKILVEIPYDFQSLFDSDKETAMEWRLKTRDMFEMYFKSGYTVTEFLQDKSGPRIRNYYLMERDFIIT